MTARWPGPPVLADPAGWSQRMRAAFLDGGLAAVRQLSEGQPWVHLAVTPATPLAPPALYAGLAGTSRQLLAGGLADQVFFVHKPPGIRWRLRVSKSGESPEALESAACDAAGEWRGYTSSVHRGVYEPQRHLFGGERAMEHVHRTWTADSELWLDWHAAGVTRGGWALSLAVLAVLFDCLGVVGWEDREIWSLIVQETGRRLPRRCLRTAEVQSLAADISAAWKRIWYSPAGPAPAAGVRDDLAGRLLTRFVGGGGGAASDWYAECFAEGARCSRIGPRRAAAYWTVFHWNRARFAAARQALVAEVLSSPEDYGPTG